MIVKATHLSDEIDDETSRAQRESRRRTHMVDHDGQLRRAMLSRGETGRYIPRTIHQLREFTAIFVIIWFAPITSLGQTSVQEFRSLLREQAAFTAADFSMLEQGQMVVTLLPVKDKREVAVCGLMRLHFPPALSLRAFQESMTQRNSSSILQIGKFASPPSIDDLQALGLEDRDIDDLRECVVGHCKLKLSAAMIERFRGEVDWTARDYRSQATRLFRWMLLDYVRDYLSRGDSALIKYQDQSRGVGLAEEHRSLLEGSLYINEFSPELTKYLKEFPRTELAGVENAISWTKIKFGLKPVTILTHVVTYTRQSGSVPQILIVSKQLYANHYFDSSLAVTALINIPTTPNHSDSYLLYTNRSRADSLAGSFSKLKRSVVEGEAVTNLNAILLQTRLNLETSSLNQASTPRSATSRIVEWLFGGTRLFWWSMLIIVLIAWFGLRKRISKRNAHSSRETSQVAATKTSYK